MGFLHSLPLPKVFLEMKIFVLKIEAEKYLLESFYYEYKLQLFADLLFMVLVFADECSFNLLFAVISLAHSQFLPHINDFYPEWSLYCIPSLFVVLMFEGYSWDVTPAKNEGHLNIRD